MLVSAVQQRKSAIYPIPLEPSSPSHFTSLGHHRAPGWAPCVIYRIPTSYLFCTCSVYTSGLLSQFNLPFPSAVVSTSLFSPSANDTNFKYTVWCLNGENESPCLDHTFIGVLFQIYLPSTFYLPVFFLSFFSIHWTLNSNNSWIFCSKDSRKWSWDVILDRDALFRIYFHSKRWNYFPSKRIPSVCKSRSLPQILRESCLPSYGFFDK